MKINPKYTILSFGLSALLFAALPARPAVAAGRPISKAAANANTTIVLVHGAFADGSSWSHVIPLLEKQGFNVIAVQNALKSFDDDVATTKRVIDAQKGNVILVGHSYGGAVITTAAVGATNVKALVYIAAFAPDSGEVIGPMLEKYPSKLGESIVPDSAGFLYIDRSKFKDAFAADVPDTERNVMAATQKPIAGAIFAQQFSTPAWKSLPSWYMVASEDHAINPDLERLFAKRINAKTVEVKSSHVPMISHPSEVAKLIEQAANAAH